MSIKYISTSGHQHHSSPWDRPLELNVTCPFSVYMDENSLCYHQASFCQYVVNSCVVAGVYGDCGGAWVDEE